MREKEIELLAKVRRRKTLKEGIGKIITKIISIQSDKLPRDFYYNNSLPRICWKVHKNIIYETLLAILAVTNAIALATVKYPSKDLKNSKVDIINIVTVSIFTVDQVIRLIGQGFRPYFTDYENILFLITTVGSIVHINLQKGYASAIAGILALKIYKIIRRSNYFPSFDQLIDSIMFTLAVVMSYCSIMVLFIYIFSLLGMQFFAG
jgi:voltage-gated sodium channel